MMNHLKKIFSNQQTVVVCALIIIGIVFSMMTDKFLQPTTFTNIAKSAYYIAFMAIGVTFVIATGGMDLSIGTVAICSVLIGGTLMEKGLPMGLVLLVILASGWAAGIPSGPAGFYCHTGNDDDVKGAWVHCFKDQDHILPPGRKQGSVVSGTVYDHWK